jgi:hypothetical protein
VVKPAAATLAAKPVVAIQEKPAATPEAATLGVPLAAAI